MRNLRLGMALLVMAALCPNTLSAVEFEIKQEADGVTVNVDGKLVTRYLVKSGAKPILWPVVGPRGQELTRGYPMRDAIDKEKKDHVHHRSMWFTHGDVNGVSFWDETEGHGNIIHREFKTVSGGKTAKIVTLNDWLGPDGAKVCEDEQSFEFGANADSRWVDVQLTVRADKIPVKFGDTKEGSFGVRVAGSMRMELKDGGKILNSAGEMDGATWGRPASWVDYSGPVGDTTGGVLIMNHPSSFRYPTYWHVRTYGLFAANPFGLHDFLKDKTADGSHTLQPGESFVLKYRVLLHNGNLTEDAIKSAFAEYSK
jgi:hypothetical protein